VDAQAPGLPLADEPVTVPRSDIEFLARLGQERNVAAVFTMASDWLSLQAAQVAARLGLPSISEAAALRAIRKDLMRQALASAGIVGPSFCVVSDLAQATAALTNIGLPAVVKPVDASGSRGVIKVGRREELSSAFDFARRHSAVGRVLMESYMAGCEVSVESLTFGGRTSVVMITDKVVGSEPCFTEMGHSQPANLSPVKWKEVESLAQRAVAALGIESGATHTEVKLTPRGPKVVELGPRLGGDFIASHLVRLSSGFDMVQAALELALGQEPVNALSHNRGAAIRYFTPPPGRVTRVHPAPDATEDGVVELEIYVQPGDIVLPATDSRKRSGHVITTGDNAEQAVQRAEAILAMDLVETAPDCYVRTGAP
jgi:biotin carboxylase